MNIYYLPARAVETPEPPLAVTRWSVLRARGHRAWWRARLTATEMWHVLRRGGERDRLDAHILFADDMPAPRRRALGPARIIDLDTARRRRVAALGAARA